MSGTRQLPQWLTMTVLTPYFFAIRGRERRLPMLSDELHAERGSPVFEKYSKWAGLTTSP